MIGTAKFLEKVKEEINQSNNIGRIVKNDNWDELLKLPLKKLKELNIALQVESEVLNDTFWICSNDKMSEQVKKDDPDSVVYHIDEIGEILKSEPDKENLLSTHEAKKFFRKSQFVRYKPEG